MTTKPIAFSDPMIRANEDGIKTVTRRVIRDQSVGPRWAQYTLAGFHDRAAKLQTYQPSDTMYARQTFRVLDPAREVIEGSLREFNEQYIQDECTVEYRSDFIEPEFGWRPGMFMFRWMARQWMKVAAVSADRLQNMTHKDAVAEGFECLPAFAMYWNGLNKKRGFDWADNPWVWAISYDVFKAA